MDITERIANIAGRWAHDDAYAIAAAIVSELGEFLSAWTQE